MDNKPNTTAVLDENQRLEESGQPAVPVIGERVVPPNGFTRQNGAEADGIAVGTATTNIAARIPASFLIIGSPHEIVR